MAAQKPPVQTRPDQSLDFLDISTAGRNPFTAATITQSYGTGSDYTPYPDIPLRPQQAATGPAQLGDSTHPTALDAFLHDYSFTFEQHLRQQHLPQQFFPQPPHLQRQHFQRQPFQTPVFAHREFAQQNFHPAPHFHQQHFEAPARVPQSNPLVLAGRSSTFGPPAYLTSAQGQPPKLDRQPSLPIAQHYDQSLLQFQEVGIYPRDHESQIAALNYLYSTPPALLGNPTTSNMFSGPTTPLFSSSVKYDNGFGTPMFTDEKADYFSGGANRINTDFASATSMFDSPYPQMEITPPESANESSSWGAYGHNVPAESVESAFDQSMSATFDSSTIKMQFGQTTPPDEKARSQSMEQLQNAFPANPEPASYVKKTRSKRSRKDSKVEEGEENDEKRNKFLERNRVAASKCRQKKKEYNGLLEARAKIMERENARLKHALEVAQTEKIHLMSCISMHEPGRCECTKLHELMKNFTEQYATPSPQAELDQQQADTPHSVSNSHDDQEA